MQRRNCCTKYVAVIDAGFQALEAEEILEPEDMSHLKPPFHDTQQVKLEESLLQLLLRQCSFNSLDRIDDNLIRLTSGTKILLFSCKGSHATLIYSPTRSVAS